VVTFHPVARRALSVALFVGLVHIVGSVSQAIEASTGAVSRLDLCAPAHSSDPGSYQDEDNAVICVWELEWTIDYDLLGEGAEEFVDRCNDEYVHLMNNAYIYEWRATNSSGDQGWTYETGEIAIQHPYLNDPWLLAHEGFHSLNLNFSENAADSRGDYCDGLIIEGQPLGVMK
jgi:hypothetical protein